MRIFLAGAGGVIGRRLTPLLCANGHTVVGTTRSPQKADELRALGAEPVVVDVFDAGKLTQAVRSARPQAIIHQLTDLAFAPGTPRYEEGLSRNARLRIEGTRNLVDAAKAAEVDRMIAQSIAFVYAPGVGARLEGDPLLPGSETVAAVTALETAVLSLPQGIVLRYGYFYGPGTWSGDAPSRAPAVHVDAAAQATLLALDKAERGIYNIAEDDPGLSSEKAKRTLGLDAAFRLSLSS